MATCREKVHHFGKYIKSPCLPVISEPDGVWVSKILFYWINHQVFTETNLMTYKLFHYLLPTDHPLLYEHY